MLNDNPQQNTSWSSGTSFPAAAQHRDRVIELAARHQQQAAAARLQPLESRDRLLIDPAMRGEGAVVVGRKRDDVHAASPEIVAKQEFGD